MDESTIRRDLLDLHNLRVEPETSAYVFRRLTDAPRRPGDSRDNSIPVMGVDARTGVPVRQFIDLATLSQPRT